MSDSPHLGLGYLAPSQAQKHVTVNEALARLDAVVQIAVLDRGRTEPPASPAAGDRHIVAVGAAGGWAGMAGRIASFVDGAWSFVAPRAGWLAFVAEDGALAVYGPSGWIGLLDALATLGVNATPDLVNRLAVASEAALFTHDGADVRVKLNKAAAGDVASLVFQDGWSGRAEIGLLGSDALGLKVSPDGAAWIEALSVDPATGAVSLPATPAVQLDRFTASGTWTKPGWAKRVRVMMVGAGGGGGSGRVGATATAAAGGGGGAPGAYVEADFVAADLTSTVAVTIGGGGAGAAAQTTAATNGANGTSAGLTSFGDYLRAGRSTGQRGAGGGAASGVAGAQQGYYSNPPAPDVSGGAGATGAGASGGNGVGRLSSGGGGGGGLDASNVASAGGTAGQSGIVFNAQTQASGGAAGSAGAAGADWTAPASGYALAGGGSGGGGGASAAANGGAGGNGGAPGGAGGGGGAARNGFSSGKGGDGARGEVWVLSMR
ncbi:MAG: hypothetical protein DI565_06140 [Ancylobacter novellus]|uniref:DUF2793 domain-containing protein n=1 Tax=Ancylobacter novellus TaxID=921 RepID=A0A2W5MAY7_ANCNO|nr:MAG: hypothetical protein DI565_06140 [Ancylobacter novellus]